MSLTIDKLRAFMAQGEAELLSEPLKAEIAGRLDKLQAAMEQRTQADAVEAEGEGGHARAVVRRSGRGTPLSVLTPETTQILARLVSYRSIP